MSSRTNGRELAPIFSGTLEYGKLVRRTMQTHTRPATQDDAEKVAALHAGSWRAAYREILTAEYLEHHVVEERRAVWQERLGNPASNQQVLVAEQREQIVGFACMFAPHDAHWGSWLDNLHVAAEHQGQGIGQQLMANVAERCGELNPTLGLYLWVLEPNVAAQGFYEKIGGENAGRGVWQSPAGREIPQFRYVWRSLAALRAATAHHAKPAFVRR